MLYRFNYLPIVLADFPKQYNSLYLVRLSDNLERI